MNKARNALLSISVQEFYSVKQIFYTNSVEIERKNERENVAFFSVVIIQLYE